MGAIGSYELHKNSTRFFEGQVKSLDIRDDPSPMEWEPTQTITTPHLKDLMVEGVRKGIFHYMQTAPPSAPPPIPPPTAIQYQRSGLLRDSQQTLTPGTSTSPAIFAMPTPVVRPPVLHQSVAPAPTAENECSDEAEL